MVSPKACTPKSTLSGKITSFITCPPRKKPVRNDNYLTFFYSPENSRNWHLFTFFTRPKTHRKIHFTITYIFPRLVHGVFIDVFCSAENTSEWKKKCFSCFSRPGIRRKWHSFTQLCSASKKWHFFTFFLAPNTVGRASYIYIYLHFTRPETVGMTINNTFTFYSYSDSKSPPLCDMVLAF